MDAARAGLAAAVAARGESLAALSRLLGRNAAYLQQYLYRGSPRRLGEHDRQRLARYLGVAERELGGDGEAGAPLVEVPWLDAAAAAGAGALNEPRALGVARFEAGTLRSLGVRGEALSIIRARGDSMEPLLHDGDQMMVDAADTRVTGRGGVFVLRLDGAVLVKRVRRERGRLVVTSDNPAAAAVTAAEAARAEVIGRVVWLARTLG